MIPGFEQGVVGMRVGGERIITIPPSLGYGSQDITSGFVHIPANSTLVFDVTLVSVLRLPDLRLRAADRYVHLYKSTERYRV